MKTKSIKLNQFRSIDWLKAFLIVVIGIGVVIRFTNLESKFYWLDEMYTSLRISGYSEKEVDQTFSSGSPITSAEINKKFQDVSSHSSLINTVKNVLADDPHHSPLYYITTTYWAKVFGALGNSIAIIRSWSVVLSLLTFPLLYALCLELFEFPLVGWLAMALNASSPLQLEFAQTARYYSLWSVLVLASSLALLRAIRINKKINWVTYGASLVIGLYTYPPHLVIIIQNGIYSIVNEKFRLTKTLKSFFVAVLSSLAIFSPWMIMFLLHRSQSERMMDWVTVRLGLKEWLSWFTYNLVSLFSNFWYYKRTFPDWPSSFFPWAKFFIPFVVFLTTYAAYILVRYAPRRSSFFLFSLIFLTSIIHIFPDLVFGGIRALIPRYLIPAFLGVIIIIAYLLAIMLTRFPQKSCWRKLWAGATVTLITGGLVSCLVVLPARGYFTYWPYKSTVDQLAQVINQSNKPCVFMIAFKGNVLILSHILKPDTILQVNTDPKTTQNWQLEQLLGQKKCNALFFYEEASSFKAEQFKKNYQHLPNFQMDLVFKKDIYYLWKVEVAMLNSTT